MKPTPEQMRQWAREAPHEEDEFAYYIAEQAYAAGAAAHTADQLRETVAAAVLRKDAEIALQKISDFGQMQELLAERDALKANNERLRADAARYQLIRRGQHWSVIDGIGRDLRADELDAAIDAAMKGQP